MSVSCAHLYPKGSFHSLASCAFLVLSMVDKQSHMSAPVAGLVSVCQLSVFTSAIHCIPLIVTSATLTQRHTYTRINRHTSCNGLRVAYKTTAGTTSQTSAATHSRRNLPSNSTTRHHNRRLCSTVRRKNIYGRRELQNPDTAC
jgi:hypothetical protein